MEFLSQIPSPEQVLKKLETSYEKFISRISDCIYRRPLLALTILLFIFAALSTFIHYTHLLRSLPLILIGFFQLTTRCFGQRYNQIVLCASLFSIYVIFSYEVSYSLTYFGMSLGIFLLPYFIVRLSPLKTIQSKFALLITLLVGKLFIASYFLSIKVVFEMITFFSPLRGLLVFGYLLFEEHRTQSSLHDTNFWHRLLNPTAVLGTAIPKSHLENPTPDYKLWTKGVLNILFSFLCFYFIMSRRKKGITFFDDFQYPGSYLYAFIYLAALLYGLIGLGQVLGFKLIDPFHWPFLATNPMDRWNRWNRYNSIWYKSMLFIPLLKKYQSTVIAIFGLFIVNALIHIRPLHYAYLIRGYDIRRVNEAVLTIIIVFMSHAGSILISQKFPKIFGEPHQKSGWRGVFLTFLILSVIYVSRRYR